MGDPNNRGHNRVPLSVEVSLESEHNFYAGITNNISEGGIFVGTPNPPAVGTQISLELTVEGRSFSLSGIVCWLRNRHLATEDAPEGCGIRWEPPLDADALATIQQFVHHSRDTLFYEE
jgi:uncharacterized protein (TIGR02266 family)